MEIDDLRKATADVQTDEMEKITNELIKQGVSPVKILEEGIVKGLYDLGDKFEKREAFIPDLITGEIAAKKCIDILTKLIPAQTTKSTKKIVIGTMLSQHDIGKNLVSMIIKGNGFEVIDLGVDVPTDRFIEAIAQHPDCFIGLSALLTTTMGNMENSVRAIKDAYPGQKVLIGGAPINQDFCTRIGADFYSSNPHHAVEFLNKNV